ncbi:hypothetical protein M0R72_03495 [Candidatus Pacearchaeota archaeon]|jgi:type II secretory pathway component PulM|nr:hypothetical protein [Candidatus Pacearchaeota archaeon]
MKIKDKRDVLILILGLIVVALLLVLIYVFLVQPALNGLMVEGYYLGQEEAVSSIIEYAKTCQQLPLTYGNETINIIAVECIQ